MANPSKCDSEFNIVFTHLKDILSCYISMLTCTIDEPGYFYLDTQYVMKNKKPLYFGSVQILQSYVSFHLMPVYVFPDLLDSISPELKQRMQGKSCFNFKSVDATLFEELLQLTQLGYQRYQNAGYIG